MVIGRLESRVEMIVINKWRKKVECVIECERELDIDEIREKIGKNMKEKRKGKKKDNIEKEI